jgi:hypothetical protein
MSKLLMVLGLGAALAFASSAAWAQVVPPVVPQTGNATVDAAGQQVNTIVQNAPTTAQGVANHIIPGSGDAAKALVDIARSADPVGAVVGAVLGGLESKLLEVVLEHGKLKERVTTLEADNTKHAIDLQHARALIDQQATQIAALTQQAQSMQSEMAAALGGMEQQTSGLLARVAELERTKGTITVPFKVVDKSGFPLVVIDEAAATFTSPDGSARTDIQLKAGLPAQIYLGNMAGGLSLVGGETNEIVIVNGETAVFKLTETADQGVMMTGTTTEGEFQLGSGPNLVGLMIRKGDQPAAGLGTFDGRGIALRVFAASGMVVGAIGENPATPGSGIAYVGNGSQNAAALAVAQDGSGVVHAFAADGSVGSGLIGGPRMVAAYNAAGNAVVTIGQSENSEGGNVTARDPAGDGVFRAGYNSAVTGGDACVYRAKRQNVFCLGIGAPGMGIGTF